MPIGTMILLTAVLAYPIASMLLLRWVRPKRMRLADLGREILQSPEFTESEKVLVSQMLADAFCWKQMVAIVWHYPSVLASMIRDATENSGRDAVETTSFLDKPRATEFVRLHQNSLAAANPIAFGLYWIEVVLTMIIIQSASTGRRMGDSVSVRVQPGQHPDAHNGSAA